MTNAGVTVFPWAEYMVTNRNCGTATEQSQKILTSTGIDLDKVLFLSPETEELKHILSTHENGYILRVHTIKDLNDLAVLLYGKPLLMRINLVHTEVSSKYSADKITIWEGLGLLFFLLLIIALFAILSFGINNRSNVKG